MLSDERLVEIRTRCDKATDGPWIYYRGRLRPQFPTIIHEIQNRMGSAIVQWQGFDGLDIPKPYISGNGEFIAHARTDVPDLLDEITSLRTALQHYANPENWTLDDENHAVVWDGFEIDDEIVKVSGLTIAARALAAAKGGRE